MDILQTVVIIVFAAAVGEGINEFFVLPWLDAVKGRWNETARIQVYRMWSGLVGVGIAWELNLDVFALLSANPLHPIVGNILTGLLLGRGSNWLHELLKKFVLSNELRKTDLALMQK